MNKLLLKLFLVQTINVFSSANTNINHSKVHNIDKIFVNSIPKCGTWMLAKCIQILAKKMPKLNYNQKTSENFFLNDILPVIRKSEFLVFHHPYSKKLEDNIKKNKFKLFFIFRDPRDQIVSQAFEIQKEGFCRGTIPCHLSIPEIMSLLIEGSATHAIPGVAKLYRDFIPWINANNVCVVRFENLVGPNGLGKRGLQKKELDKICRHLNIKNEVLVRHCMQQMYGETKTFRSGKIGSWKEFFTLEHKTTFKQLTGALLMDLGYEKDSNW